MQNFPRSLILFHCFIPAPSHRPDLRQQSYNLVARVYEVLVCECALYMTRDCAVPVQWITQSVNEQLSATDLHPFGLLAERLLNSGAFFDSAWVAFPQQSENGRERWCENLSGSLISRHCAARVRIFAAHRIPPPRRPPVFSALQNLLASLGGTRAL